MTDATAAEADLLARWTDVHALGVASGVLGWDQETMMPAKGQAGRGATLAALAGLAHERLTDPALTEAIDAADAVAEPGSPLAAHVRQARRQVVRATAVPGDLTRALAGLRSRSLASWQRARADDDLAPFADDLAELVARTGEAAQCLVDAGIAPSRYDALLDEYEPGATEAELTRVLGELRDQLAPLAAAAADSGVVVDESPWQVHAADEVQDALAREVARAQGYDLEAGRIDPAAHPFTTGFGPGDVRITSRYEDDDLRPGLLGSMHEVGHALYEQGLPPELDGTPAGGAVSLGVHESQSRLWENLVGRSRAFWTWATPVLARHVPATAGTDPEALWRGLHPVRPSLIRVEADEATYNLHIIARFEVERALFDGSLDVADVGEAWDDAYERLLGIRPPSPADGVLQDIHWSMGAFGYFPTYTLGNLIASQLFEAMGADLGDLDAVASSGDLAPIVGWLRDRVHRHASLVSATELVESATGRPLSAEPLLRHLRADVEAVYGVRA